MNKKVSIITPVYNGEEYIERYINSIIMQSYDNIELIIIDDGSTDKTKELIQKSINIRKEVDMKYIYQKNGGQAVAIANGIKYVTGEFLVWADADDYYEKEAINSMVSFLNLHPEADVVRCNAIARDENNLEKILYYMKVPQKYQNKKDIFEDCIFVRGINCFPGVYMVRFEKYKENNPNLFIYQSREGQNWQLLLPSLYKHKCYYLNKNVYNYVIRKSSHSHMQRDLNTKLKREESINEILKNTIEIFVQDFKYKSQLFYKIDQMYLKKIYYIYLENGEDEMANEYYKKIEKKDLKMKLRKVISKNSLLKKVYKKIRER